MYPFVLNYINSSYTCYIFPRETVPNGLYLTYETCPENYNNETSILVSYCCLSIIIQSIQNSYYKKTQDWILYNSSTVLLVPAVFFNVLSLIVLNRFQRNIRNNTRTSTTFYMRCICIFDTLTIVAKFLNEILVVGNGPRKNPIPLTSFMCKTLSFSESVCAIVSIYLLIAMSFDKLVCVIAPLKVTQILTSTKARLTFSGILLLAICISSFNLFDKRVYQLELEMDEEDDLVNINLQSNYTLISMATAATVTPASFNRSMRNSYSNTTRFHANNTNKKITYDCDSNWPERKNDWILFSNIIRVFLPILSLCICNIWIVCALGKAKRNTDALFARNTSNHGTHHHYDHDESVTLNKQTKLNNLNLKNRKSNKSRSNSKISENEFQLENASSIDFKKSNLNSSQKRTIPAKSLNNNSKHQSTSNNMHVRGRSNTQHISIMLFAVSFGFVVLNLPFAIRTLFHRQFQERYKLLDYLYQTDNFFATQTSKTDIRNAVLYEFFSSLTHLLLDLNYIGNFFLYFFSGTRFRAQLISLLRCEKVNNKRNTTNNKNKSAGNLASFQAQINSRRMTLQTNLNAKTDAQNINNTRNSIQSNIQNNSISDRFLTFFRLKRFNLFRKQDSPEVTKI